MRAVVQRVKEARVEVNGRIVGEIGAGLLVFLGIEKSDTISDVVYLASKVVSLRIFPDESGKFDLSLLDTMGKILLVSQFTLLGDCRKGKRPSFDRAAGPDPALDLYKAFIEEVKKHGIDLSEGEFQAMMDVFLINDGPVTMLLDSKKVF
ncbi:MAG: D-aminoacyl-tRNA deacylase [Pseudomonadota bacterium]